jgi:uracil-DNA glycosylase
MNIEKFFQEAKANFQVHDIRTKDSRILFILESPHKEELKYGIPLAGLSGKSMAKVLFKANQIEAMGKYLKKVKNSIYGIVNVCPFPLQASAYPEEFAQQFSAELNMAESVRTSMAKIFRDQLKADFQAMLIHDFKERLLNGITEDTVIVPCGRFAQKYVDKLQLNEKYEIISGVPHPSYNSWAKERYKEVIDRVRQEGKIKTS